MENEPSLTENERVKAIMDVLVDDGFFERQGDRFMPTEKGKDFMQNLFSQYPEAYAFVFKERLS